MQSLKAEVRARLRQGPAPRCPTCGARPTDRDGSDWYGAYKHTRDNGEPCPGASANASATQLIAWAESTIRKLHKLTRTRAILTVELHPERWPFRDCEVYRTTLLGFGRVLFVCTREAAQ